MVAALGPHAGSTCEPGHEVEPGVGPRQLLPQADRLYLTEVQMDVDGDTHFPRIDPQQWREVSRETVQAGPSDSAGFVLRVLERRS